jgi:N-carbamoylputrescine amidase
MHIPDAILISMKILFYPGDLGFKTIPTQKKGKIGTLICWINGILAACTDSAWC